jgi:hypothetical protein
MSRTDRLVLLALVFLAGAYARGMVPSPEPEPTEPCIVVPYDPSERP